MKQDVYIGVDGGGTKTKVIVEDAAGNQLSEAKSGPGNIRNSAARAWASINEGIDEALKLASIEIDDPMYSIHVGLGLAGTEVPSSCEAFLRVPHPYETIQLETDAYVACLGVHGGEDGAIIIIGTGVVGYRIEGDTRRKVGGWGFPHADEGGGAWLGMEVARLTFKSIDGRIEKTPLLDTIYEQFNESPDDFVTWAGHAKPGDFGTLAPFVMLHLEQGDPHALALVDRAALEIQLVADALKKDKVESGEPLLPMGLLGGIAPFIEPYLSESLHDRLVPRKFDATKGAVIMIRDHVAKIRSSSK